MWSDVTLSWEENHSGRKPWSAQLLTCVHRWKPQLEQGNPGGFVTCPYHLLSTPLQHKFWAEFFVAIALYESHWNPHDKYLESWNVYSVGLFQLSYEDQKFHTYKAVLEPASEKNKDLEDPLLNIRWAVAIMATWLSHDHVVAHGSGKLSRGGARYWSTLRVHHKVNYIKDWVRTKVPFEGDFEANPEISSIA